MLLHPFPAAAGYVVLIVHVEPLGDVAQMLLSPAVMYWLPSETI